MKQYIVDAFTDSVFHGNQAAICVLDEWIPEDLMMNITKENNFSETAFVVKEGEKYHLRWFTPGGEIDLCGHATLATAYVMFRFYLDADVDKVVFTTLSGDLIVSKKDDLFEMEFPAYNLEKVDVTDAMVEAIVSRSFAPKLSVVEDPVCGSGHCHIVPYWAEKFGKNELVAYQASSRGGTLYCRVEGDKIFLAGKATLFSECELFV